MNSDLIHAVSEPCLLGESPFWHPLEQALYWCDIAAHRLYRLDPVSGVTRHWQFDTELACCAPVLGGGLLLAMRDGLWRFDPDTGARQRLARPPYDPAEQRFNDGKCDPQGRFWVGTINDRRQPKAALYRWSGDALDLCAQDVTTANGLGWSLDGSTMYWSDTKAHRIDAFDFDVAAGGLSRRRVHRQFAPRGASEPLESYGGRPDGAAVDTEGCYWVAMYEGQRLLRLAPDASVQLTLELPVRCPTMPCFGGADLKTLYITSASHGRPEQERQAQPLAGCVLALRVDVPGLPVNFAQW
jgi:sugar lactone lactonase YvrE